MNSVSKEAVIALMQKAGNSFETSVILYHTLHLSLPGDSFCLHICCLFDDTFNISDYIITNDN
jgi:hypothetical protein